MRQGFSGLCPCCPVKPRPIGPLNLPTLFPSTSLFGAASSGFASTSTAGPSTVTPGASGAATFQLDPPGSVEELRRKAQEHSAALFQSLQQQAMEFHLQQQQRKSRESAESDAAGQSD